MTEMSDDELLLYCDGMVTTERCGFAAPMIARLLRLAGREADAAVWDREPGRVVYNVHDDIRSLVAEARTIRGGK
jgi:hypothetical protein